MIHYYLRQNNKEVPKAIKNQKKWQKNQINIYYNTGRPLFDYYYNNGHLMRENPFSKKKSFIF